MSLSFVYAGSDGGVDGKCSCEGMQVLCDLVASRGSRCIGSGCNSLGNVLRGSRIGRMVP